MDMIKKNNLCFHLENLFRYLVFVTKIFVFWFIWNKLSSGIGSIYSIQKQHFSSYEASHEKPFSHIDAMNIYI